MYKRMCGRGGFKTHPYVGADNYPPLHRFVVIVLLFIGLPLGALSFTDELPPEQLASALVAEMTDEEALAQTFMLGWVGSEPSPLIMDWISQRGLGGVKIFGWNTADTTLLAQTVGRLQSASLKGRFGIPLFVATDQEGGVVRHIKGATSESPGNMAIGAGGYPRDAYLAGYYIGRELRLLGVNMNFAPTVDLFTNRNSTIIGPRAFGNEPVQAGILGAAFVKGQEEAGIISTAKHYPGHGDTALDSHGTLPRIPVSRETLENRELIPYKLLAKEGIPAIMSGHLAFPNTEGGETPASLSSFFLNDILREELGFKGLIITDDMMMVGATNSHNSLSAAAKEAMLAGNDVIMLSKTPLLDDAVWTRSLRSMQTEPDFNARVRKAAEDILRTKLEYLKAEHAVPSIPDIAAVQTGLPDKEGQDFFLDMATRSVTLIKADDGVFPLKPENAGRVMLAYRPYGGFISYGEKAYPDAMKYWYAESRGVSDLLFFARQMDTIIFCVQEKADLTMLNALKELALQGKRVIVFSLLSPVELEDISWVAGAIAVYSFAPESFNAGFSAMLGRIPFQGELP
ncbi:MAG: glycoside hydrolase family 3 protein [Spirochaetaceae bacterium]|jgi:beta-N-acetylhexosaminidase|nr:glycoside hydrolase family 3 protein [Spirochaetaceae bacterium]